MTQFLPELSMFLDRTGVVELLCTVLNGRLYGKLFTIINLGRRTRILKGMKGAKGGEDFSTIDPRVKNTCTLARHQASLSVRVTGIRSHAIG